MGEVRKRVLTAAAILSSTLAISPVHAQKFFPDDPLWREPAPLPIPKPLSRNINEYFDFFQNTFFEPGKEYKKTHKPPPSGAVNTMDEVPDSAWFTNRIGSRAIPLEELVRGPGNSSAPATDSAWQVLSGKNEGVTPGLMIRDSKGRRYLLKFDPKSNPEMASAADVIGSKFFYDIGYNTPENYIVTFTRAQLTVGESAKFRTPSGHQRGMKQRDIDDVLDKVPRDREGRYRAVASLLVQGDPIGAFRYYGTRKDDPNDIVDHETRRDLRGLYVFAAWLNHTDTKSINSLDTVIEDGGARFIRHYLIDFGAILGSDSFEAKSPRAGNVYLFDFAPAAWQFVSLGLYVPRWMRADYPHIRTIGHLEYETFKPDSWKNNYPNPAFDQRTPGDTFWAAKKLMAFTDEAIRAIVQTGEYSDPEAVDWTTRALIERRNRIGRAYFDDVLPLDSFAVRDGELRFEDLAVKYGFLAAQPYQVEWSEFDNAGGRLTPIPGAARFNVPQSAQLYLAARIRSAASPAKTVTVYLRRNQVVGVERTW